MISSLLTGIFIKITVNIINSFANINNILYDNYYKKEKLEFDSEKQKETCLKLKSCIDANEFTNEVFVLRRSNNFDSSLLNFYRILNWEKSSLESETASTISLKIKNNQVSIKCELAALSQFTEAHIYLNLLYSTHFNTGISALIRILEMNDREAEIKDISNAMNYQINIRKPSEFFRFRLTEFVNLLLINQHNTAWNYKESAVMFQNGIDFLYLDIKSDMLNKFKVNN